MQKKKWPSLASGQAPYACGDELELMETSPLPQTGASKESAEGKNRNRQGVLFVIHLEWKEKESKVKSYPGN